jgi:ABC-type Fe3+ transport system substrate-binding protein
VKLFNKKFGLNKEMQWTVGGVSESNNIARARTIVGAGGSPEYFVYSTGDTHLMALMKSKFALRVENWEKILPEINSQVKSGQLDLHEISPHAVDGYGFVFATRTKGMVYNTNRIKPEDLPKNIAELAEPRFAGRYGLEAYTTRWQSYFYGYKDRPQEFLKLLSIIGKNAGVVARSDILRQRIAFGDFDFVLENAYGWAEILQAYPQAPVQVAFFPGSDIMSLNFAFVPTKSQAPATGALWAMFMTTPEAGELRGQVAENVATGSAKIDKVMRDALHGKKLFTWLDAEGGIELVDWFSTKDGKALLGKITSTLRQR